MRDKVKAFTPSLVLRIHAALMRYFGELLGTDIYRTKTLFYLLAVNPR